MAIQYAVLVLVGLGSLFLVRIKPPTGVALDRTRYPKLFEEIDRLCTTLQAPKPHQVILTDDLNAAVLQAPKFGLAAWYTNYLLLGLPLMQVVSPGQFRATLAHEMGHLAGNHSRFSGWVYRVRRAWALLAAQQGDRASIFLYPFFKWYEPFFRAYSFVLSRNDEYFADHCAASYAGRQNAAEDLIQIYVKGAQAARIVGDLWEQTSHQPAPPSNAVSALLERLQTEPTSAEAQTWLEMALVCPTDTDDTHPALAERLAAYSYRYTNGNRPQVPFTVSQTAADYFLGQDIDWAVTLLDAQWQTENARLWQQQYDRAQIRSQFRDSLVERAKSQSLTVEEALKLAILTVEFDSAIAAIDQLRAIVERAPQHAMANFQLGKILLGKGYSEGLPYLQTALQQEPHLLISGFEPLYAELHRQGQQNIAQTYLQKMQELLPRWQRAQREREEGVTQARFVAHGLPPAEIAQISWQLSRYPEVREAYLVQRVVKYLPERQCYVLGLVSQFNRQNPRFSLQSWELAEIVSQTLCLSADVRVLVLNDRPRSLYQSLRKIANAKVV